MAPPRRPRAGREPQRRDRREADRVAPARAGGPRSTPATATGISASAGQPQWRARSSSQVAPKRQQPVLVGRQRDVVDPQAAQLAATSSRRSRSSAANRSRTRRREVSTSIRSPALGIDQRQVSDAPAAPPRADRRSRPRAPSGAPAASRAAAPRPAGRESREITTTSPGWRASRATRRSAPARPSASCSPVGRDALGQHAAQRDHRRALSRAAAARAVCAAPNADEPDAARSPDAEPPEHERHALGDVGLQPPRGPERHRRRHVEHDPGRQRALGHVQADVRLAGRARSPPRRCGARRRRPRTGAAARARCRPRRRRRGGRRAASARRAG